MNTTSKQAHKQLLRQGKMIDGELHLPINIKVGESLPDTFKASYRCSDLFPISELKTVTKKGNVYSDVFGIKKGAKPKYYRNIASELISNKIK